MSNQNNNPNKFHFYINRFIYTIATALIAYAGFFLYAKALTQHVDFNQLTISASFSNGFIFASFWLILFLIASNIFLKRIFARPLWKKGSIIIFFLLLEGMCYVLASAMSTEFGNTWNIMDIHLELILSYWQSWISIIGGTLLYLVLLKTISLKKMLKNPLIIKRDDSLHINSVWKSFLFPTLLCILPLTLLLLLINNYFSFGKIINQFFPCTQNPQDSFPCFAMYDIYVLIILVGISIISLYSIIYKLYLLKKQKTIQLRKIESKINEKILRDGEQN